MGGGQFGEKPYNKSPLELEREKAPEFRPTLPTSHFDAAFEYTVKNEGGYTDDPADHGGKTNYGIIESEYSRWLGRTATEADMRALTKDVAKQIYRKWYWEPLRLSEIVVKNVAIALFDRAVLNGLTGVSRFVRNIYVKPKSDAPNFHDLILKINGDDPKYFVLALASQAEAHHRARVAKDPSQAVFLKGWLNRVERQRKELGS